MIWKLSMTGIKSRLRDYMILFSGLIIASAIFYMFQSLATNKAFLEGNTSISMATMIFQLGTILLTIITIVYILYANSFLMTLRQRTYAMLMMLGAKTKKIAQIIFLETFIIGLSATLIGILVGVCLTYVVNYFLMSQLDIVVTGFSPFNLLAIVWTLSIFSILFIITSLINSSSVMSKQILQLLNEQSTTKKLVRRPILSILEAIFGSLSLALGYYMLDNIQTYKLFSIEVALVTIVIGSYCLFHAIAIVVLSLMKNIDSISMKKLTNFTLSQLTFRIREYTQILTMVSILFALAMGAITVGLAFRSQPIKIANNSETYDLVLNNSDKINQKQINDLDINFDAKYSQKEDSNTLYYNSDEFNKQPLQDKNIDSQKINEYTGNQLKENQDGITILKKYMTPDQRNKEIKFVSNEEFNILNLPKTNLELIKVVNFKDSLPQIKKLVLENNRNNPSMNSNNEMDNVSQKYETYQTINSISAGFQFMGFFLGLAFLTMLASCLMFKILSSANTDKARFQMLRKIGTRQSLLKKAVIQEIGVLFFLPGILGIIHVLFGLQMFKEFISNPYEGIWIPFSIFIFLYTIYYVLTVVLYSSIVIPKELDDY
ncbi:MULTISPECIES: FtsX-like permease family protein [Vagococcus]|uniref:FtsX-like permease family protein n=1 Tax=Vagococcus TaxID=2737 RepID=UPI000E4C7954|nr:MULTISPECIES: FtsX-like permease family protein [Vagococcus]RHH67792.1 ABC transporter permease [Vagococcus sp. AM17-17]